MNPPRRLVWLLWILLLGFCSRVLGQVLVAFLEVTWLPPMKEWYSGLMPYPLLLPRQMLIIALSIKVCWDFTQGDGFFVQVRPLFWRGVRWFGYVYLAAMVFRYIIHMSLIQRLDGLAGRSRCLSLGVSKLHHRLWGISQRSTHTVVATSVAPHVFL